jgi:hypothetical protein
MPSTTTAQKLKIREGFVLKPVNAPPEFKKHLTPLPPRVKIVEEADDYQQVHWFVRNRAELSKNLNKILSMVKGDRLCWIYYPKGTSGIQTDLNRDTGWDELLKVDVQFISLISFDDTWSVFGIRQKTDADRKKEAKPKSRPVFDYVDPVRKTVTLPEDLASAFKRNKKQEAFFNTLSFSNKKEYIEWIVTAKRDETRKARVEQSVERLGKEWKNPANR